MPTFGAIMEESLKQAGDLVDGLIRDYQKDLFHTMIRLDEAIKELNRAKEIAQQVSTTAWERVVK